MRKAYFAKDSTTSQTYLKNDIEWNYHPFLEEKMLIMYFFLKMGN